MQCVILAGGLGKRLRPITETVPKPLVPVLGRPVVQYTLEHLPAAVDEIIFVIGYKGEMLKEAFGEEVLGRRVRYAVQEEPRGTGHAVQCAKDLVRGPFLLLMGDDVYGPEGLRRLTEYSSAALVRRVPDPERFGVFEVSEDRRILRVIEKPDVFVSDLVATGAYALPSAVLDVTVPLSPRGEIEVTDMVNVLITRGVVFRAVEADVWLPANTQGEVVAAEQELLRQSAGTENPLRTI